MADLLDFFSLSSAIVLGNGRRTLFWRDKWAGNICLRDEFPRLFSLSNEKFGTVNMFYSIRDAQGNWSLNFRRALFSWEVEEMNRLSFALSNVPALRENVNDGLRWTTASTGLF